MLHQRLFVIGGLTAALLLAVPVATAVGRSAPGPRSAPEILAATALGDAFTYQGRLTDNSAPANGAYDLRFILYDAETGGAQVGSVTETKEDVAVTQGLFTTSLNFGATAFNGDARWLEIAVRPGNSTGTFTVLSPRQPISPTPYALFAKRTGSLAVPFSASGAAASGTGVLDITSTGAGSALQATASTDGATALTAKATGSGGIGAALSGATAVVLDGALKVSGAKTAFVSPAVVSTGTGANVCDSKNATPVTKDALVIDNVLTNGDASAILLVTINGVPATDYPGFGVAYAAGSCGSGKWAVYSSDHTALIDGLTFNVLVIKQ